MEGSSDRLDASSCRVISLILQEQAGLSFFFLYLKLLVLYTTTLFFPITVNKVFSSLSKFSESVLPLKYNCLLCGPLKETIHFLIRIQLEDNYLSDTVEISLKFIQYLKQ